jgi:glutamate transport system permease protein
MTVDRVLFDTQGPRARRRVRYATVVALLAVAGIVAYALRRFGENGQLAADRWQPFAQTAYIRFLWQGLEGTLKATAMAALLAFPLGAVLALLRLARNRVVSRLAAAYVELFRAVPLLLLIYAFLLALPPRGINLPIFWKLVVPIVLVNAAVLAEVFRAGIRALDPGQSEAASAIGLSYWQSMRIVVFPQAVRLVVPALVAQLVSLLKDSTLGYVVSYPELMKQGNNLTVYTHLLVQTYIVIAVVYVVINLGLSQLASALQRRLRRTRRFSGDAGAAKALTGAEEQPPSRILLH